MLSSVSMEASRLSIALGVVREPRSGAVLSSVAIEARMLSIALVVGGVTAAGQVLEDPRRGSAAMLSVSMEASTSLIAPTEAAAAEVDANGQALEEP